MHVRVEVLGPTTVTVDGCVVRLTPLTVKLLLRLVAAGGQAVSANQLYRDLWPARPSGAVAREHRIQVQKRIVELRRAIDPRRSGEGSALLCTERVATGRETESAYRLALAPHQLDCAEFGELVTRARSAAPATAGALLTEALRLWRGAPLVEVTAHEFAQPVRQRLLDLHGTARRELVRAHIELGQLELALPAAESLADDQPQDSTMAGVLHGLRARLRERHGDDLVRHELTAPRVTLVIRRGDLFDQHDANLVAGFVDTFETATDKDLVVSRDSVQGQLVERIFGGDRAMLDRELRRALRRVESVGRETARDKPRGKRVRYRLGTVAAVPLPGRRLFAVAYSRLGNDLVARSNPDLLRQSLDQLWASVAVHGLFKPVAIPLVGTGLARITESSREQLLMMILESFVRACHRGPVAPELRVVLRPAELERMRIADVARFVETLEDLWRRA